jgi:hypothetical protein
MLQKRQMKENMEPMNKYKLIGKLLIRYPIARDTSTPRLSMIWSTHLWYRLAEEKAEKLLINSSIVC